MVLLPERAWRFSEQTPRISTGGWLQGAVMRIGRGRLAVFGEAAMFTAQRAGENGEFLMGMNAPAAMENAQFILNLMHWLTPR